MIVNAGGRMRAQLVRVLVLMLAPLVVLSGADMASAVSALDDTATTVAVGPTVTGKAHAEESGWVPSDDVSCSFTGYIRLNSLGIYSVRNKTRCDFGSNFDAQDAIALRAYGGTNDGERCSFEGYYAPTSGVDLDNTLIPFNLHSTDTWENGCAITRGTVQFFDTDGGCDNGLGQPWWFDLSPDGDACPGPSVTFDWNMGTLPQAPADNGYLNTDCSQFDVLAKPAVFWGAAGTYGATAPARPLVLQGSVRWKGSHVVGNGSNSGNFIAFLPIYRSTSGALRAGSIGAPMDPYTAVGTGSNYAASQATAGFTYAAGDTTVQMDKSIWSSSNATQIADWTPIGVQISYAPSGYSNGAGDPLLPATDTWRNNVPQSWTGGDWGMTRPTMCRFYFGEKVAVDDTTTSDDPAAGMGGTVPPPPTEDPITNPPPDPSNADEGCDGFSFLDPTSWAGAGICVLVKALRAAVGVLQRILTGVGDIVDAIGQLVQKLLDGIQALFVPDSSSWDLGDLKTQFQDRPPGSVLTAFGSIFQTAADSYNDSAGCGVIAEFNQPGVAVDNGTKLDCTAVKNWPGYSTLFSLVKAGLLVGTAFLMFNMAAARFKDNG